MAAPLGSSIDIAIGLSMFRSIAFAVIMLIGDWFEPAHFGAIFAQFSGPYAKINKVDNL